MITWLENTKLKFWREFSQYLPIYRFIWSFKHFRMDNPLSNVYTDRDFQCLKSKSLDVCIVVRHRGTKEVTMRKAHRMPYFSVLGILKYGIGWRPQNAPFENCSIWEMFDLRIAPFEKCSIWEMLHLRNVRFENCFIWEMLHLRNVWFENCSIREMLHLRNAPFENCSIWELLLLRNARFEKWGWRQIIHFEKAAILIKMVKFRISRQFSIKEGAVYHEIINGPSEQGLELYHLY